MSEGLTINWAQLGGLVSAVGALGLAAFGTTEALGKAFAFSFPGGAKEGAFYGLPYTGLRTVRKMVEPLRPALSRAYGTGYMEIIAQQYRADRSSGRAPDTIRQGVRLGLPFLDLTAAAALISAVWDMEPRHAESLALALQAEPLQSPIPPVGGVSPSAEADQMQALAGRFSTALDTRVNAAFALAEERYEARAKLIAGATAVVLSYGFNAGLHTGLHWQVVGLIGLVAVPLAPVAKDLSSSLQDALTAFKSIPTRTI